MPTLSEFLLARLDEEEEGARIACGVVGGDEWEYAEHWGSMQIQTVEEFGNPDDKLHNSITMDYEGLSDSVDKDAGPHIAYWDPARVLADIEAKRVIIRECRFEQSRTPVSPRARWLAGYTLQTMVRIYANHKDYQSEWEWVPL